MIDVETLIVGAGPAGTAAAIELARHGRDALVVDRATFPRDKCCGDGLTALALRELEHLGLEPSSVDSWRVVDEVVIRAPGGRERRYRLPDGPGYHAAVARRTDLDAALVVRAGEAGATIEQGVNLRDVTADDHGITAEIDGLGTVRARHLIAADGMWSPVRKALGLRVDGYRGEWHAFRQYYENVSPRAGNELIVWFEKDLLPGYAWSFPLADGRANIGFGIQRGGAHAVGDMKQLWPDLLSRPHIREVLGPDAQPEDPHKAWPIPARVGRVPLVGPHTMFVGDAAAVTDPMTGEGIGQALLTGRLAAEAIMGDADAIATYEREVRRELVADDRMARVLIPLLARPLIARGALKLTGATGWTRRNFARWMFEDYPRAMVATPRRWHRGMFTGAGAYRDR
ncbi:MAG: menaquinone reductase [Acidimicrobiales bacterium]|nr:MAG: menaquinone reductase [Acidimicrobiales bacterium]